MSTKSLLVLTDFTTVSENALNHALHMANVIGTQIWLLHVVSNEKKTEQASAKLSEMIDAAHQKHPNITILPVVKEGSLFDVVGETAKELHCSLIFMGTHGLKGIQKLRGSNALKVVTNSPVPFIVVQEKQPLTFGYKNIVLPLDLSKETKQKLSLVSKIAQYFNSKVHIITPKEKDEFLKNQLNRNLKFAAKFLHERRIEFTSTISKEGASKIAKEAIKLAETVDADLIAIMNLQENSLMGILGSTFEQAIITNELQIPVICINPTITTVSGGVFSS
ncbi:MAG: nucleotide-binding universal stress UspA family protein [Flavobacteriales bacterium]|jgi:nucleotide-binding universal stress UspA family protein